MNVQELLFEMPKLINDVDFNLSDPKVNARVAVDLLQHGELLEDLGDDRALYQRGHRLGMVANPARALCSCEYYVQYKEIMHKMIGHRAISQIAVWRDDLSTHAHGLAARIFWDHLLPIHGVMITDALQTKDGRRFWMNRIGEAYKRGLNVYYLNLVQSKGGVAPELLHLRTLAEFKTLSGEREFWGLAELHERRKILIAEITL